MRELRHPLAVLRYIIGLNQQELADLCGCSRPIIESVELLRRPFTKKLAMKIADATGVSIEWLLDGNAEAPPEAGPYPARRYFQRGSVIPRGDRSLDEYGKAIFSVNTLSSDARHPERTAYTRSLFEHHRALLESTAGRLPNASPQDAARIGDLAIADNKKNDAEIIDLCRKLLAATLHSRDNVVVRWQIKRFLNNLISEIPSKQSPRAEIENRNPRKAPKSRRAKPRRG